MARRRKKARRGFAQLSTGDLRAELARREGDLARERARLASELARIDEEMGGVRRGPGRPRGRRAGRPGRPPGKRGPGRPRGSRSGRRARNESNLVDSLKALLTGKTMSVTDATAKVQESGYKTTSPNFRTIVNQALLKAKNFRRVSRGQYTAK